MIPNTVKVQDKERRKRIIEMQTKWQWTFLAVHLMKLSQVSSSSHEIGCRNHMFARRVQFLNKYRPNMNFEDILHRWRMISLIAIAKSVWYAWCVYAN